MTPSIVFRNKLLLPVVVLLLVISVQSCKWFEANDTSAIKHPLNDSLQRSVDSSLYLFPRNFFLVSFEFVPQTKKMSKEASNEFATQVLIPGYTYIDSLRQSGVPISGGVFAVEQGCAFIIQADNNEKLHSLLKNCPLNPVSKITVKPLVSLGQHLFELKNWAEQSAKSATAHQKEGEGATPGKTD